MKRIFSASTAALLAALLLVLLTAPAAGKCKNKLADCPEEGCPTSKDKGLNRRKNATSLNGTPELKTLSWMKDLAPRVRQGGRPHFTLAQLRPLVLATPKVALQVRVSGQLMFDSEHYLKNPLVRVTDWEIHPIFKLEYCPSGTCTASSDQGWQSLDALPIASRGEPSQALAALKAHYN